MEIDVMQEGGFWLPSVPLMLSLYAPVHGGEVLWVGPNGALHEAEEDASVVVPRPCAMRSLLVSTRGPALGGEQPQPEDDDLLVTVRKNGADTLLHVTIPAGSVPSHTYLNRTNEAYFALGDRYSIKLENLAGADSVIIGSIGVDLGIDHALR